MMSPVLSCVLWLHAPVSLLEGETPSRECRLLVLRMHVLGLLLAALFAVPPHDARLSAAPAVDSTSACRGSACLELLDLLAKHCNLLGTYTLRGCCNCKCTGLVLGDLLLLLLGSQVIVIVRTVSKMKASNLSSLMVSTSMRCAHCL